MGKASAVDTTMCKSSAAGASKWSNVFESVLLRILANYKDHDKATHDAMDDGMRKLFENGYPDELTALARVVERDGTASEGSAQESDVAASERGRQVFFAPWPSDMRLYAAAFRDSSLKKGFRYKLLSVFYTVHSLDNT